MRKSFLHQAVRLLCRFLIKLSLVLAFVPLPVAFVFVILPSAAAAKAECDCSNLQALQAELRNALRLQEAFRNKVAELRTMQKGASTIALKQFAEGEARRGLEPVPGYKGPSEVDYHPWGRDLYDPTGTKHSTEKLCNMAESAMAVLNATIAVSACPGIGRALRAHEEVHLNFCQRIGFLPYEEMHGADRAQEEVEAYGAQIKVLRAILDSLRCGYRVSEQWGPAKWQGVICSLESPFTLEGSSPPVTFNLNAIPSSVTSGTWTITTKIAIATPVSASASGTYTIEGANTETPRLVPAGSYTANASGRSGTGPMMPAVFKLLPLETDECSQPSH